MRVAWDGGVEGRSGGGVVCGGVGRCAEGGKRNAKRTNFVHLDCDAKLHMILLGLLRVDRSRKLTFFWLSTDAEKKNEN